MLIGISGGVSWIWLGEPRGYFDAVGFLEETGEAAGWI